MGIHLEDVPSRRCVELSMMVFGILLLLLNSLSADDVVGIGADYLPATVLEENRNVLVDLSE